ncbi:MAG: tetratricopeptide repeat protein, partial [Bacteroidales bacterium]|nr:tetratricopeptide repeat protein [Bacteroidales bacterium]
QFEPAVKDFDKYIRQEPRDPSAYLNRGASYLFLGDTLKAVSDYNQAIKIDRFEPEGYIRRGRLLATQGDYEGAIKDMNKAIELDSTNTLAYFNRAILHSEQSHLNEAMADLNTVLRHEPGNALTLYNRSLIHAQVGDFPAALSDMDRVININPNNVLAYFNRAGFFLEMGRWDDALADYNKAIELYPDFAKAYMNRAYAELQLGMNRASREDYKTGRRKVAEYRAKNAAGEAEFADTTKKYSSLLALDAEFAKHDFEDEMLQHRDVDINLKPLYKFVLTSDRDRVNYALERRYENPLLDRFCASLPLPVTVTSDAASVPKPAQEELDRILYGGMEEGPSREFLLALSEIDQKQYNAAQSHYDRAIEGEGDRYELFYRAFYYMNRAVLRAEMIDFIASIESNVQTLTMDDKGNTRARVREQVTSHYDYSEALADMEQAAAIQPALPYIQFNLGNLYCLSSQLVNAIECYGKAIAQYPYMGDAYFNRGLVLIYLKDKEKGCIDLSRAGELGLEDAYNVISRYCEEERR